MRIDEPRIIDIDGLVRSPRVLLAQTIASATAQVDFTDLAVDGFLFYEVEIKDLVPDTDDTSLTLQFSTDNGASFLTTGYDRLVASWHASKTLVTAAGQASFHLNANTAGDALGTAAGEKYYASIFLFPLGSGVFPGFEGFANYLNASATRTHVIAGGLNDGVSTPANAVRLSMSTGNLASGTFSLFGWGWRGR